MAFLMRWAMPKSSTNILAEQRKMPTVKELEDIGYYEVGVNQIYGTVLMRKDLVDNRICI